MAPAVLNCCLAVVRWTPVIFITAVVVWSYYAYVIEMCFFTVESIPEKIFYLVLFHPVLFMFAWAYWQVIFTNPGSPPKEFLLPVNEMEAYNNAETEDQQREILHRVAKNLPVQCRTVTGGIRFCEKCKSIKPDRAHHCSVCGMCILKMDHHCPWVNNCVCFTNYKYFVLFLGYALVYCLYVAATSLQYFIKFWTSVSSGKGMTSFHILFLFFIAIMFAISLTSLFAYHIFLTLSNRSTLESFRAPIFRTGPDKDGFSLGKHANFQEVFGDCKATWFLPIYTSLGDGVTYPTRVVQQPNSASYNSMDNTVPSPVHTPPESELAPDLAPETTPQPASFGDGKTFPIRSVDEDYDSLLGQRQRWMEEGEADGEGVDNYGSKH